MSPWRQISRGLRALSRRRAADQDIADEVQNYLEEAAAALVAGGASPDAARRAARVEFGNATAVREQVRSYGWENAIAAPLSDLRFAARRLRANPGFTAVSVLTRALGIGASTAIFSIVEGVLLKPLPYPHSEQLVAIWHTAPGIHIQDLNMAFSLYFTYHDENRVFQDIANWTTDTASVTGLAEPEEVPALVATHGFLPVLGVEPVMGRPFNAADDDPAGERTVILSYGYWKSRFGGDRSVLGRRLMLDGNAHQVIGVLPQSFQFMDRRVSLLLPQRLSSAQVRLISFGCQGIARLKPGVTLAQAS